MVHPDPFQIAVLVQKLVFAGKFNLRVAKKTWKKMNSCNCRALALTIHRKQQTEGRDKLPGAAGFYKKTVNWALTRNLRLNSIHIRYACTGLHTWEVSVAGRLRMRAWTYTHTHEFPEVDIYYITPVNWVMMRNQKCSDPNCHRHKDSTWEASVATRSVDACIHTTTTFPKPLALT